MVSAFFPHPFGASVRYLHRHGRHVIGSGTHLSEAFYRLENSIDDRLRRLIGQSIDHGD